MSAPAEPAPAAPPPMPAGPTLPRRAVVTALVGTIVASLPVFLFGGLATLVRRDLGFGVASIGVAVAAYFAASSLASPPGGRIGERLGPRRAILGGAAVNALALLGLGFSRNLVHVGVALAVGGVGNAVIQPAANLLLTQHVGDGHRGLAFGIKASAIPASALLGGLAVAAAAEGLGWRGAFWAAALIAAVLPLVTPRDLPREPTDRARRRQLHRITVGLALLAAAAGFGNAAANSLSAYLVEYGVSRGMSPSDAGLVLAAGSAVGLLSRIGLAWRADRRGTRKLRLVALLMGAGGAGFLLLATAASPAMIVIGTLVAFLTSWGWAALFIYSVVQLHPRAPAASTGVTQSGAFAGSLIGPPLFGYVVATSGFEQGWLALTAATLAGATLIAAARRRMETAA
jgi:MFS family permease